MTTALIATARKSSWTASRVENDAEPATLLPKLATLVTEFGAGNPQAMIDFLVGTSWQSIDPTQTGKAVKGGRVVKGRGVRVAAKDDDVRFGPRNSGDADFMYYLTPERITVHVRNNGKWVRVASGDYAKVAAALATAEQGEPTDEQATA